MSTILDRILDTKRDEVAALRAPRNAMADLRSRCDDMPPTRGFTQTLAQAAGTALIAEVKKASPSKGLIRPDFDPVAIASAYRDGGAHCLSILTDKNYFQGDLAFLADIRAAVPMPLLRKDFLIDTAQVWEARAAGADAVLLIVAALPSPAQLAEMRHLAELLGMDALVEVHDEAELEIAVQSGATLIGVNNRDLHTFDVRLETSERLIPQFPAGSIAVAESGIFTNDDVRRLADVGAKAVLVGESLMRQSNTADAVRKLLSGTDDAK